MSKLTRTIISMSNLVSAGPGNWKELHDMALELEAKLEQACKDCGTYRAAAFEEHAKAAEVEAENEQLSTGIATVLYERIAKLEAENERLESSLDTLFRRFIQEDFADAMNAIMDEAHEARKNAAFFRSCALSGEVPQDGDEPFPTEEFRPLSPELLSALVEEASDE